MIEFVLAVFAAFFFYLVVLPLVGILGSFCARIVLPYLIGSALIFAFLLLLPLNISTGWLAGLALMIWCAPALVIRCWPRTNGKQLGWQQGHYRACFTLLTCGFCSRHEQGEEAEYTLEAVLRPE